MFPEAEKIILVMDNLNTHKAASLYKAFPPDEARRIIKRLEIHYTPKHGSWLDMAEIELNVMTRQCLSRRIATIDKLKSELSALDSDYTQEYVAHFLGTSQTMYARYERGANELPIRHLLALCSLYILGLSNNKFKKSTHNRYYTLL